MILLPGPRYSPSATRIARSGVITDGILLEFLFACEEGHAPALRPLLDVLLQVTSFVLIDTVCAAETIEGGDLR